MSEEQELKERFGALGLHLIDKAQEEINEIHRQTLFQKANIRKSYATKKQATPTPAAIIRKRVSSTTSIDLLSTTIYPSPTRTLLDIPCGKNNITSGEKNSNTATSSLGMLIPNNPKA